MTLVQRLTSLIQAIAQDIKSLGGRLEALEGQGAAFIDSGTFETNMPSAAPAFKVDFGGFN